MSVINAAKLLLFILGVWQAVTAVCYIGGLIIKNISYYIGDSAIPLKILGDGLIYISYIGILYYFLYKWLGRYLDFHYAALLSKKNE
jgi:hypothetical protein